MCTNQEATTQECSQLKADKARLWDKIDMLKADKAYLLAEQVKLPSQTMELKEIEWKPQELQVKFALMKAFFNVSE